MRGRKPLTVDFFRSLKYERHRGFKYSQQETNNCNVIGCGGSDDFRSQGDDAVYAG